jgi:hypothetical protein
MARKHRPDVRGIAEAIMRRAPQGNMLVLSDPPTLEERLHLMAARIDQRPIIVVTITRFAKDRNERDCTQNGQADHAHPRPTERR